MQKILLLQVFYLLPLVLYGQFSDSFNDTLSPYWTGDRSKFSIDTSHKLRLNDVPYTGKASVSHPSKAIRNAAWEFYTELNFEPTTGSYVQVALVSNQPSFANPWQGYFLRIGWTEREVALYRKDGSSETKILDGINNRVKQSKVRLRIKVEKDSSGAWKLFTDTTGSSNYVFEGSCIDTTYKQSSYVTLHCVFSSTRYQAIAFDDFLVKGDTFVIKSNEPVQGESPGCKDILFNEIMADPTPVVGQPDAEYLECVNVSGKTLELSACSLWVGKNRYAFSTASIIKNNEHFLIGTPSNKSLFPDSIRYFPLFTSATTLTNDGTTLKLMNTNGVVIDAIQYKSSWYKDSFKSQGGYSLERKQDSDPCGGESAWIASDDRTGGTPGRPNSVWHTEAVEAPWIVNAINDGDSSVLVHYSAPLHPCLYPQHGWTGFPTLYLFELDTLDYSYARFTFAEALDPKTSYTLDPGNYVGCSGLQNNDGHSIPLLITEHAEPGDVKINEILFNPHPNEADFVEFYNASEKIINLADLEFFTRNDSGQIDATKALAAVKTPLLPHAYVLFTKDKEALCLRYSCLYPENIVEIDEWPAMNDDEDNIGLRNKNLNIFEEIQYSNFWHSALLKNPEGYSLERKYFESYANDPQSWHSASYTSGGSTPGYINSSTAIMGEDSLHTLVFNPSIISPNLDGRDDFLEIKINAPAAGYYATLIIFDTRGSEMLRLLDNDGIGTSNTLRWEGLDKHQRMVPTGIYLFYLQMFNETGSIIEKKGKCVVVNQ